MIEFLGGYEGDLNLSGVNTRRIPLLFCLWTKLLYNKFQN